MGRKKRRRRQTDDRRRRQPDDVIQFPRDPNVAEEMLLRFRNIVEMQAYQKGWARRILEYQSEDDPHITQTFEEFVAEQEEEPFVDGTTEEEMRREYSHHIEGSKSFLTKIADNTSVSDDDLEYIRTLLAHEFRVGVFDHTEYCKRMLVHYGKFVLDLFPDYPMEEFGGLQAFQERYELLQEYEGNLDEFLSKEITEFENWLKETAPKKKSNIRVLDDEDSDPDLSHSNSE